MKLASRLAYGLTFACLVLGGCVETRFESPLGDNIETCDARWKGLWNGVEDAPSDRDKDATAFHVNDDCEFTLLDQPEKGGPLKRVHVPLNYVHAGGNDYIVVADSTIKGLVTLKPPHAIDPAPDKSFFFARYRVRGDRIELYPVDSAHVAKLIIDGKIDGTVDKSANDLHVFVRGNRAQMLDLVRSEAVFETKPTLQLVRSKQTLGEFEQSLQHAARGKTP
jgi:hypothetical protein